MKRIILVVALILCGAAGARGQGAPINLPWVATATGAPKAGATISICAYPSNAIPCTNYASVFSDIGLTVPINQSTTPIVTDSHGNVPNDFITAGIYAYTVSGVGISAPQGPFVFSTNAGVSTGISIISGQVAFGNGVNTVGGDPTFTWDNTNKQLSILNTGAANGISLANPTASTAILAQSSPILLFRGQSWNGATSVNNDCTFQNIPANGANAGQVFTVGCSLGNSVFALNMNMTTLGLNVAGNLNVFALGEDLESAAATNIANQPSPPLNFTGAFWNGATSVADTWTWQSILGAGNNPTTTYTLSHTGSSGAAQMLVQAPLKAAASLLAGTDNTTAGTLTLSNNAANAHTVWASGATTTNTVAGFTTAPTTGHTVTCTTVGVVCTLTDGGVVGVQCGTMAAGAACTNTFTTAEHFISGIAILSGGTSTFTGISPAFTSASTFFCVGNDITTPANTTTVVPASATTVTVTGTGTDHIQFVCMGG
jgi:hypothetical protein